MNLHEKLFKQNPKLTDKQKETYDKLSSIFGIEKHDSPVLFKKISVLGARVIGADITGTATPDTPENREMLEKIKTVFLNFLKEQKFLDF